MRARNFYAHFAVVISLALLLASCSSLGLSSNQADIELTEQQELANFGYTIDYVNGWQVIDAGNYIVISELETDHNRSLEQQRFELDGYQVAFEHRTKTFLANLGLPQDPTLDDLLEMNRSFFEWQEPLNVSEEEIFGEPSYRVKTTNGTNWEISYMGFKGEQVFLFGYSAATEEALDQFEPTWEAMLASIEPAQ